MEFLYFKKKFMQRGIAKNLTDKALQNARYNPLDNRKWEYY